MTLPSPVVVPWLPVECTCVRLISNASHFNWTMETFCNCSQSVVHDIGNLWWCLVVISMGWLWCVILLSWLWRRGVNSHWVSTGYRQHMFNCYSIWLGLQRIAWRHDNYHPQVVTELEWIDKAASDRGEMCRSLTFSLDEIWVDKVAAIELSPVLIHRPIGLYRYTGMSTGRSLVHCSFWVLHSCCGVYRVESV